MTFAGEWDRRDRLTLWFAASWLEPQSDHLGTRSASLHDVIARWSAVVAICLALVGCSGLTQTPFERSADEAAGTLAAAAETLNENREGRLTEAYARASFVSFAEALRGVGERLPRQEGAPGAGTAQRLGQELRDTEPLLEAPCLASSGCDASAQIRQLKAVSDDLMQASQR